MQKNVHIIRFTFDRVGTQLSNGTPQIISEEQMHGSMKAGDTVVLPGKVGKAWVDVVVPYFAEHETTKMFRSHGGEWLQMATMAFEKNRR